MRQLRGFVVLAVSVVLNSHCAAQSARPTAGGPVVVDFGGAPADTPIAGLDQWRNGLRRISAPRGDVLGTKRIMVLRVYFHDYPKASRYTTSQVQGFFDNQLNKLWQNSSYGKISLSTQVTDLYQLPAARSKYITDHGDGDTSDGAQYDRVLIDAIAFSPNGLDWNNIDAVVVVMAETDPSQFHRGQGGQSDLPMGRFAPIRHVGAAIFSENPSDSDALVYGRWSHELGHAFQQGGPPHPSNYDSAFEQMDANYPGQTGVFEKQANIAFPGWMPPSKYQVLTPAGGGGVGNIWAEEYDPAGRPNYQAVKAMITDNLYYMISVRRRVLGDDLNGFQTPAGIPDEGVLIERVTEGADKWVEVQGNGDRNTLWHSGTYNNAGDGIYISMKKLDNDDYQVSVHYDANYANQPDVMINPWHSPPGNTTETTDIWIDSPVNGYGTYRYGYWDDGTGYQVPQGNGDDPALGQVNRFYVRVRNVGYAPASNIVVHVERTDPPGLGIAEASGWVPLNGTVANSQIDSSRFPALASVAAGAFTDVYLEWTPDFPVSADQLAQGTFYYHTCVRVKIDPVVGETVLTNQDGIDEQENLQNFQAVPVGPPQSNNIVHLHNDDLVNPRWVHLNYTSDLPAVWDLKVNGGNTTVQLPPGATVDVPVDITPSGPAVVGSIFGVDLTASYFRSLASSKPAEGTHLEFKNIGGIRVESRVMVPTSIECSAVQQGPYRVFVSGVLHGTTGFYDTKYPPTVMIEGLDVDRHYLNGTSNLLTVKPDGSFAGYLTTNVNPWCPYEAVCLFAGTDMLASAYARGVIQNVTLSTLGDLDGDCRLTSNDIVMMLRIAGGLDLSYPGQVASADTNGNGQIDVVDATYWARNLRVRRSGSVIKSATNDYFGYGVYLDDPYLNGNANARIIACHQFIGTYNGPVGVYYYAGYLGGRWAIFNEDNSPMAAGERFNYYFGDKVRQVDKSAATSTAAWRVTLSDPALNGNPGAVPMGIHDWLHAYNNSPVSVWRNSNTANWELYNDNFSSIVDGERLFFADASQTGGVAYHNSSNTYGGYGIYIDDARLNGNPGAIVLAQHNYQITSIQAPLGVWYSYSSGKWVAFNEGSTHTPLAIGEGVNYLIAQP